MRKAAAGGFINATDCADWLTKNGVPFRDAYKATGELVARCIELGTDLENLPLAEYKAVCDVFTEDVYNAISLEKCVSQRTAFGGPAPQLVKAQAQRVREIASERRLLRYDLHLQQSGPVRFGFIRRGAPMCAPEYSRAYGKRQAFGSRRKVLWCKNRLSLHNA